MENADIRILAMQNRVKLYQIAEYLGIWDSTLSRKLRHELPEGEKAAISWRTSPQRSSKKKPLASCWKLCLKVRFSQVLLTYAKRPFKDMSEIFTQLFTLISSCLGKEELSA